MAEEEQKKGPAKSDGKKHGKKQKAVKIQALYDISGGLKRKNKACPKCGAGVFMAQHKNRVTCGKCGYTEFSTKKAEEKKG